MRKKRKIETKRAVGGDVRGRETGKERVRKETWRLERDGETPCLWCRLSLMV